MLLSPINPIMVQICTFFLDRYFFGLPIHQVQEVIRSISVTRVPLAPPDIYGLINLRNQIITVIDLQCRLGLSEVGQSSTSASEPAGFNVIVRWQTERLGLLVDDMGDVLDLAAPCESPPATLKGVLRQSLAGVYLTENDFLFVLDIHKVLNIHLSTSA